MSADVESELLLFLYRHTHGHGPPAGVPPFRVRRALGIQDADLAPTLDRLRDRGLIDFDMVATTPFNNPSTLQGVNLTNIDLTAAGWETVRQSPPPSGR